jgi:RNA polymerase sigma-70 factor (ECF subfamily)
LAARLRQGDENALEGLLRAHGPPVHRVLCRKYALALREADIDDVLAIALYRVWQARRRYDAAKGSLRVWFFRIAENAARDVLRHGWHKARRLEVTEQRISLASLAEPQTNGKPAANSSPRSNELKAALREVVAALPEAQRKIIAADALCREGVASSQYLAEELQLSETSIRVYRKRALDAIRAELVHRGLAPREHTPAEQSTANQ